MNGLKSILNQSKLGKYSIVIAATTFLATMSGMWFLRSLSISSNNYIRISEQKTLPSLTLDGHKGWVYEVAISADGKSNIIRFNGNVTADAIKTKLFYQDSFHS